MCIYISYEVLQFYLSLCAFMSWLSFVLQLFVEAQTLFICHYYLINHSTVTIN